jgi:hypothetical protein
MPDLTSGSAAGDPDLVDAQCHRGAYGQQYLLEAEYILVETSSPLRAACSRCT